MNTMVSVIIPNYNRVHYLEQALVSVMGQTYMNWEAIVIDDGSRDNSKDLVRELMKKDGRIRLIERQIEPRGAAMCRNIGIDNAKGEYIVFLDSDDLLASNCLQQRVHIMKSNTKLDFTVFKMQFFNQHPGDDNRVWNLPTEEETINRFLKLDSVWQTSGPIWKRIALQKINGFDPSLACWQDVDIHLKALFANLKYKIYYNLPADCYYRKDSADSISQSNTNSLVKLKSKKRLYHLTQSKANSLGLDCSQMALHILASAISGHEIQFFWSFYREVKDSLSSSIKNDIVKMMYIRQFRLYKISYFQSCYLQLKNGVIQGNLIGQFDMSSKHQEIRTSNPLHS